MLGLKLSHLVALPALWFTLSKWRSRAQPLYDAADLEGTELPYTPAGNAGKVINNTASLLPASSAKPKPGVAAATLAFQSSFTANNVASR